MKRRLPGWAGLSLLGCLLGMSLAGQVTEGDITIAPQFGPHGTPSFGYSGLFFQITNRSTSAEHEVRVEAPVDGYARGNSMRHVSRTIRVPAGTTQVLSLWVPPLPVYGGSTRFSVDGRRAEKHLPFDIGNGYNYQHQAPVVLVSPGNPQCVQPNYSWVPDDESSRTYGSPSRIAFATSWQPALWSPHWLTYTQYAGIIVTGSELTTMPAGVREALFTWTEAGGVLVVTGSGGYPGHWAFTDHPDWRVAAPGFGLCYELASGNPNDWGARAAEINRAWRETSGAMSRSMSIAEANEMFQIVDNVRIPVRGLLLGMLVFVLLAGPANLGLLIIKNRRMLFYFSVPVISLIACLSIAAYAFLAEGWRGSLRTEVVTLLDQRSQRAVTLGWTAFYSPVTPADGLHFDYETELTPMVERFGWSNDGTPRVVNWSQEQHLSEGWITARIPAHFRVRKCEPRRERLVLRQAGEALSATNGLGAMIEELYVTDPGGEVIYEATRIAPGATSQLAVGQAASRTHAPLRDYFSRHNWQAPDALANQWKTQLPAGMYLAKLNSSPFLEDGLSKLQKSERITWVLGYLDEEAMPDAR